MNTREELKAKWARLKEQEQTVISITVNTKDDYIISCIKNITNEALANRFWYKESLLWDISEVQLEADPHTDCEIWPKCPLWIRDGRRD